MARYTVQNVDYGVSGAEDEFLLVPVSYNETTKSYEADANAKATRFYIPSNMDSISMLYVGSPISFTSTHLASRMDEVSYPASQVDSKLSRLYNKLHERINNLVKLDANGLSNTTENSLIIDLDKAEPTTEIVNI